MFPDTLETDVFGAGSGERVFRARCSARLQHAFFMFSSGLKQTDGGVPIGILSATHVLYQRESFLRDGALMASALLVALVTSWDLLLQRSQVRIWESGETSYWNLSARKFMRFFIFQ